MKDFESIHLKAARTLFPQGGRSDPGETEDDFAIVAFTNRSGSNLVCNLLTKTGTFGRIGEFLNADTMTKREQRDPSGSLSGYLDKVMAQANPRGRIPGVKASGSQIYLLHSHGVLDRFRRVRVIHCHRHDVIAQAVSFSIAFQTKKWTSRTDAEDVQPRYDFADIRARLKAILREDQQIVEVSALLGLPMVDVLYESLVADREAELSRVLAAFGLKRPARAPEPELKKQGGALNEDYAARFRREYLGSA